MFASVGFCIACGRRQLVHVKDIWGNRYFSTILIMMAAVFVPVENWILHQQTGWETTFMFKETSDSTVIALATLLHILVALFSYWLSMFILHRFGPDMLIKMSMWAFTIFFVAQGMFYETLMYPGTYEEYHSGVPKTFWSFFLSDTFVEVYIVFFAFFGPAFYFVCITWNSGGTKEELRCFIRQLLDEILLHAAVIYGSYFSLCILGLLPKGWDLWRLIPIFVSHFIPHIFLIIPLCFCPTKEREE